MDHIVVNIFVLILIVIETSKKRTIKCGSVFLYGINFKVIG